MCHLISKVKVPEQNILEKYYQCNNFSTFTQHILILAIAHLCNEPQVCNFIMS